MGNATSELRTLFSHLFLNARLAQLVERGTFNPEVKGSSPLSGENFFARIQSFTQFDEETLKESE